MCSPDGVNSWVQWPKEFSRRGKTIAVAVPVVLICLAYRIPLLLLVWVLCYEGLLEFHEMLRHMRLVATGYHLKQCDLPHAPSPYHVMSVVNRVRRFEPVFVRSTVQHTGLVWSAEWKCIVGSLIAPLALRSEGAFLGGISLYFAFLTVATLASQQASAKHRQQRQQQQPPKSAALDPASASFAEDFLAAEAELRSELFESQLLLTFLLEFAGFVWATGLCWGMMLRFHVEGGATLAGSVLVTNWVTDIAAMIVGRLAGRTPLCPALSPKKTVEGSVAGVAGSAAAGVLCWAVFKRIDPCDWTGYGDGANAAAFFAVGLLLGAASVVGDLIESFFKRAARLKDTGTFFPSHGGVLDRVDGLLFVFPIVHSAVLLLSG